MNPPRWMMRGSVLLAIATAFVLVVGGVSAATPERPPAPFSPSHWWPADGTAEDAIGDDDGQLLNGAAYAPGLSGQAFRFDGQGAEVRFDAIGGNFDRNPFTLAFFIRTTSLAQQAIWEKRPVCNAASFWGFRMSNGVPGAELMSDEFGNDYTPDFSSGTFVADEAWHHIALVRDGTTAIIYVDGSRVASATTPQPSLLRNDTPMRAGMSACTFVDGTLPFEGDLDELLIYDHALNGGQIRALIGFLRAKR